MAMSEHPITPADHAAQAIVDLINASPRTPSKTQIADVLLKSSWGTGDENAELAAEIRAAMSRETAAIAACGKLHAGPAFDGAEAFANKCADELRALEVRMPSPPQSFADIALRAEIALHCADRDVNGRMNELDHEDIFHASAARLIEAVLQFARTIAPPAALPALSLEHLKYRKIVAEIERYNEPGMSDDDEETDAALTRLQEQACEIETEIWAKPAKTLADLLLRAEIALCNENGVMDALADPGAYYDDLANAQLIRAVLDVLGGPNAL
jgi:hypothetical protein